MTHTQRAKKLFLSLSSPLSLVAQKALHNKCASMCDCRRQQKMEAEPPACVSIFVTVCLCTCLYSICVCVCMTMAVQGKLLTSFSGQIYHCRATQKPFVRGSFFLFSSCSLCQCHFTFCHLTRVFVNPSTWKRWIWGFAAYVLNFSSAQCPE